MRISQRKNQEPGKAARFLKPQKNAVLMPDRDRRRGEGFYLDPPKPAVDPYKVLLAIFCGGSIALAAYLLRLMTVAAHIPFPGR